MDSPRSQQIYDDLEALCARIIQDPAHEWTRHAICRLYTQWMRLKTLVQRPAEDVELLQQLDQLGYKTYVNAVDFSVNGRKIVTFYCPTLDALVGSAIIDSQNGYNGLLN